MKARKLFYYKGTQGNVIVEMVIWELPGASAVRPHGLKYRLYCGQKDRCIVRYDNELAKGDHRHYGESEASYDFQSVEMLIKDFKKDCVLKAGWKW